MSDIDRHAEARQMVKAGRSDEAIQAATELSPLEVLELRAEMAAGGTTLRWIIPNIRGTAKKKRGLFKWLGRD